MSNQTSFLTLDQQLIGDIYTSDESWDNFLTLCDDFGARFSGTPEEEAAAHFLRDKLISYGLQNVQLEPFTYLGWRRGTTHLKITHPIEKELDCITLPHSPPTQLKGSIIDLGDGAPETFDDQADAINGRIAMANSHLQPGSSKRWIHRMEKYGRSVLAGASGFIFVNHYPAYGPATGGVGNPYGPPPIPAISIRYEDGAFIQRLLKRHGRVDIELHTTDELEEMVSWNVTGELPGTAPDPQLVMLGCHYDGHDIAQGAGDPASGTVAVLEAARVLAQHAQNLPHTLRFIFWGAEEIGLIGSHAYVDQHQTEHNQMRFYLNMDSAGAIQQDIILNDWPDLAPLFEEWQAAMALDFQVGQSIAAHSDHYPLLLVGVPTGGIEPVNHTRTGRGYGHTRYDTVDKVKRSGIQAAAALGARLAHRIATTEAWPVSRRSETAVTAALNKKSPESTAFFNHLNAHYQALYNQ